MSLAHPRSKFLVKEARKHSQDTNGSTSAFGGVHNSKKSLSRSVKNVPTVPRRLDFSKLSQPNLELLSKKSDKSSVAPIEIQSDFKENSSATANTLSNVNSLRDSTNLKSRDNSTSKHSSQNHDFTKFSISGHLPADIHLLNQYLDSGIDLSVEEENISAESLKVIDVPPDPLTSANEAITQPLSVSTSSPVVTTDTNTLVSCTIATPLRISASTPVVVTETPIVTPSYVPATLQKLAPSSNTTGVHTPVTLPIVSTPCIPAAARQEPALSSNAKFSISAATASTPPPQPQPQPQPQPTENVPVKLVENSLYAFLKGESDGLRVITYYEKKGKLNDCKRSSLCNLIIRRELRSDPNKVLSTAEFHKLSELICETFPKELKVTYYHPFAVAAGRKRQLASGKLWNKYVNLCRDYRADGIRKNRRKTTQEPAPIHYDLESISDTVYNELITWLNGRTSPWKTVVEKWKLSSSRRIHQFDTSNIEIDEYFTEFPALTLAEASELILIDFATKYPDHVNCFIDSWPSLQSSVLSYVNEKIEEDPSFANSIKNGRFSLNFTDEESRNVTTLRLLVHIIPIATLNSRTKKQRLEEDAIAEENNASVSDVSQNRKSRREVLDRFILHVHSSSTFETDVKERVAYYQKHGKRCQAFIIMLGDNPGASYYVFFNGSTYPVKDILSAVDLCFKVYMVFNAEYPTENLLVWTFIQWFIYKIEVIDGKYPSLATLASDLDLL